MPGVDLVPMHEQTYKGFYQIMILINMVIIKITNLIVYAEEAVRIKNQNTIAIISNTQ